MVDEYQDSNYIQECITFLLAGKTKNICVVGDDDQGLYRFRRATIRNILEFKDKFDEETKALINQLKEKIATQESSLNEIINENKGEGVAKDD